MHNVHARLAFLKLYTIVHTGHMTIVVLSHIRNISVIYKTLRWIIYYITDMLHLRCTMYAT